MRFSWKDKTGYGPRRYSLFRALLPARLRPESNETRRILFRLLGLFRPQRWRIVRANVYLIVASFVGVFSLLAFLPVLRVIFQDEQKVMEVIEAPAQERGDERSKGIERAAETPLIGPLLASALRARHRLEDFAHEKRRAFYRYLYDNQFQGVVIIALVLLGATLVGGALSFRANLLMARAQNDTLEDLSLDLYAHCMAQDLTFYDRHQTGSLMTRVYNDVQMLREPIKMLYGSTVREPVTMLFLLIALFLINKTLTLIVLAALPLLVLPLALLARKVREISRKEVSQDGFVMDVMQSTFAGIKLVKAFGTERLEAERFRGANRKMFDRRYKRRIIKDLASSAADLLTIVGVAGILLAGALMMFRFDVIRDGSEFLMYIVLLNRFYKPVRTLSNLNVRMQRALMSARRIFEVLDRTPRIADPADPEPWPEDWDAVRLENVHFRYVRQIKKQADGSKVDKRTVGPLVLDGLDATIPRGETTAIIGPNGSGKSTIASLICRFYLPEKGAVKIGPTSVERLKGEDLRRHIVLLTQETILVNASVMENIAYGAGDPDEARALEAAKLTHADDFIEKLPDGYDTQVGERGGRLSGGQRQLIALARAVYHDPQILILDEPEASLDPKYQDVLRDVLREVARERTVVVITHRAPALLDVDHVISVRHGRARALDAGAIDRDLMEHYA